MENKYVLTAENVSKKFSKNLRRSMIYGTSELFYGFLGKAPNTSILRKSEFWALNDININLSRGQILGVVGPNGSGKTTLLRILAGIYPPDIGSISIHGRTAALIALGAGFHPQLTGLENIYLKGTMIGMSKIEIAKKLDEIIEFSELGNFINTPVSNYSSGMRVRLGFSIATASNPDLLLLDEVLAVGDRQFKAKCFEKIDSITENAGAIFVTHNMNFVSRICTDIIVMEKGGIIFRGNNVSEGINHYNSIFQLNESSIVGKSSIKLKDFKFSGGVKTLDQDEQDHQFTYGDDINISISMALNANEHEYKDSFTIRIVIVNSNFLPIIETISKPLNFSDSEKTILLNINFATPELSPGRYSVSVEILDSVTEKFIVRYNAIKYFDFRGEFSSRSIIYKLADWRYKKL